MSEPIFTPLPWHVETSEDDPYGNIGVFADSRLICELWQDDAPVREYNREQHANAQLISAAPDLYTAIREYLDWGAIRGSDRDLFEQKFRAALQKAEGA